jgi:hypothetical protein
MKTITCEASNTVASVKASIQLDILCKIFFFNLISDQIRGSGDKTQTKYKIFQKKKKKKIYELSQTKLLKGITLSHPQIYFFSSKFNSISLKFYFSLSSNLIYFFSPQISSSHLKSLFYPQIEPRFPQNSSSHLKSIFYPQNLI